MIRQVQLKDASAICAIYNYYIANTIVTFEEEALKDSEMAKRIKTVSAKFPWIVFEDNGEVIGYAYASSWKDRSAYRYSVESTIYLKNGCEGKGIGTALYETLLADIRKQCIHAVIGGISLPNASSIALHEKLGFKKIGQFNEVGMKFGKWVDVGYWQLNFEKQL